MLLISFLHQIVNIIYEKPLDVNNEKLISHLYNT